MTATAPASEAVSAGAPPLAAGVAAYRNGDFAS